MPPPVIRYAITNRHLLAAHERDQTSSSGPSQSEQTEPPSPKQTASPQASLAQKHRPFARMEAHGTDLQFPAQTSPDTRAANLAAQLAHLLRQAHRLRPQSVDYLQLREKDLAPADLRAFATALRRTLPSGSQPRLLLNLGHPPDHAASLATALAVHADGLHLPSNSPVGLPAHIRAAFARVCRSTPILSTSAHTLADITAARAANLDLILFGPVFGKTVFNGVPTGQTVTPAIGLDALAAAVHAAGPIPVLALGGITPANTAACLAAGARGIAGIRLFL